MQVHSTCECQNHGSYTCVWVINRNCLALVFKIVNNALHQDIKQSSQKNIICRISHNMELEVQHDLTDLNWNILHEALHLINLATRQLDAKLHFQIIN